MDRLISSEGFDVPAIIDEVRRLMGLEANLAAGGGFPGLRRHGNLPAARAAIPDDLINRLAIVGPLPMVGERLRTIAVLGITHVSLAPASGARSDEIADLLRRLRQELAPVVVVGTDEPDADPRP
jgi:hypothetical protein